MEIFEIIGMASILTLGLIGIVYLIVLFISILFALLNKNDNGKYKIRR